MWPVLALSALAALAWLHWWWRRRYAMVEGQLERSAREAAALQDLHLRSLEAERRQQEALFNSIIEGVLVLDHRGRIRLVNEACRRLFGLPTDLSGKTVMEAVRHHELLALVEQTSREGQVLGFELSFARPEARCFQVNSAVFLGRENQPQGMVLVFHDLTRIKQLEDTRREFVANVSHELRTPLSMIKGFVETLMDGAKDDPTVCLRFLHTIHKHSDRLTYLVEDLLTLSRLESGEVVMNLQPVFVRAVAEKICGDLLSRAEAKQMTVENQVPEALAAHADVDRLQQVFFNLVENAIKYGPIRGQISLGGDMLPPSQVKLWVRDNGPGIPLEAQPRIFERFYRVDRARSRETGGTGLGLAIVKHIVQNHHGEVWVESQPGQGTTFYLTLPAA